MVLRYRNSQTWRKWAGLVPVLIVAACLLPSAAMGQGAERVAVISHMAAPADTIEPQQLLDFYSLDIRQWDDDVPIVVFDLRINGPVRDTFYDYLGKSSARMKSVWLKKMLSGEADPPEALKDEKEMVKRVASTKGALGFVPESAVTDSVKVLARIPMEE